MELPPHLREIPDAETNPNLNEKVELQNDEEEKITEKEKTEKVKESRSSSSHHKKHKKEKKKKSSKDHKDEKRRGEHEKIKTPDSKSSKESKRPSLTMINLFGVPETKPKKSKLKDKVKTETKVKGSSPNNELAIVVKVCQSSLVLSNFLKIFRQVVSFQDYKPPKGVRFNDDVKVFKYGNSPMNRPLYNNNERTETVDEMVNNILTELINKVVDGIDHEKDVILDELPIGGKFLRMPAQ